MNKNVEVTLRLIMEFDAGSISWLEELADKAREQGEVTLLRVDSLPSSVVLENLEEVTMQAHVRAATQ